MYTELTCHHFSTKPHPYETDQHTQISTTAASAENAISQSYVKQLAT